MVVILIKSINLRWLRVDWNWGQGNLLFAPPSPSSTPFNSIRVGLRALNYGITYVVWNFRVYLGPILLGKNNCDVCVCVILKAHSVCSTARVHHPRYRWVNLNALFGCRSAWFFPPPVPPNIAACKSEWESSGCGAMRLLECKTTSREGRLKFCRHYRCGQPPSYLQQPRG